MTRVLLSLLARRLMRNSKSGNIPNVGQMNLQDNFFFSYMQVCRPEKNI